MKVYVAHIFVRQLDIIRTVCCCFVDVRKIFFGGFLGRRPDEYLFWMFRRGGTFRKDIISIRVTRRLPFVKIFNVSSGNLSLFVNKYGRRTMYEHREISAHFFDPSCSSRDSAQAGCW